jgi:hypothetical protein
MSLKRKTAVTLIVMVVALVLIPAGTALADAASPASCLGHEASAISPAGSSEEFPGGMPQLVAVLHEAFPGVPLGQIVSQVAKIHAGSHEGCDEATE